MKTRILSRHALTAAILAACVFTHQAAQACPGCRQAVGMGDGASGAFSVNGVGLAYGLSIIGLLLMIGGLLSGLGFMAYKNCQIIAARQRAMLEAEEGYGGGMLPASGRA